ncbi:alpha-hydroxy-acid oxidizing protein [Halobellus rufus]|uniref:alpha-hydroxy-acid oxidizing protein n=1 Tax=Halobellus rufus TaxID=1448860 RepID=UPI0006798AEE|nr:alpha-hydroxy-acid oxidizing protein [Halobellus rufus]
MADDTPAQPGTRRMSQVFEAGRAGETPDVPMRYEALEAAALDALSPEAYDYVAGGAGGEDTVDRNREAFREHRLLPRVLRDVGERDLSTTVCGTSLSFPVMLAPVGVQSIIHEEGEAATARAAEELGMGMVSSSAASTTMEDIAAELDDAPGWFQLYWSADDDLAKSFVDRAAAAGYEALVVTLDTPMLAWRERDMQRAYLPFLDRDGVANYFSDPTFQSRVDGDVDADPEAAVDAVGDEADVLFDSGIRRGADVLKALALGADAVLLGRPYVYGLALDGAAGVRAVCENLLADLDLAMGLVGRDDVADVDESVLAE